MKTSSPIFFKALATIAKQQTQSMAPAKGPGSDLAGTSSSKKKKTASGMPFPFSVYPSIFLKPMS
jgi:hypothetical protein